MLSIRELLPRARRLYGAHEAIADESGWLTFEEVARRVDALCAAFGNAGLTPGDRVGIIDFNSRPYLEAYYACAQSGLVLVPINSRLSGPEVEYILNDCGARALIYSAAHTDLVVGSAGNFLTVETLVRHGAGSCPDGSWDYEAFLTSDGEPLAAEKIEDGDIAQIYYTSGTTGSPKGVALTHSNMMHSAFDAIVGLGLTPTDHWMHTAPMFHLVDAWSVWAMPLLGGRQSAMHFEPERMLRMMETLRVTSSALPPTLLNMVADHPKLSEFDLSSLRMIMYGGSPMTTGTLTKVSKRLRQQLVHAYGITETSGIATLLCPLNQADMLARAPSAGQPVPHIGIQILDDRGSVLGPGEVGEVVITGPRIMSGYWGKKDETDAVLINGAYHTGDLGCIDTTFNLTLVDRKKDMIISGGENVYSAEVENLLSGCPGIAEVAVIGIPSPTWGEQVHAVVLPQAGASLDEAQLIAWCRGRIAGYKIPKSVTFAHEPLPKNGPGKIAKRVLREPFWKNEATKI